MCESFIGSLWRCGLSGLPSLTLDDVVLDEEEKKNVPGVDEHEEPKDDDEEPKSVELTEGPSKAEDTSNIDEEPRVEKAVDVEA